MIWQPWWLFRFTSLHMSSKKTYRTISRKITPKLPQHKCSQDNNTVSNFKTNILICLLRNLYARQEATVRTGHGTTDWFHIGKGVRQGCILLPCLFNLYAEYIMGNAWLEETQAGIRIAGRNINNLRYADDTTLMAESEEELKRN